MWIILVDMLVVICTLVAVLKTKWWSTRAAIAMFSLSFLALFGLPSGTEYDTQLAVMHLLFLLVAVLTWRLVLTRTQVVERWSRRLLPPFCSRSAIFAVTVIGAVCMYLLLLRTQASGSLEEALLGLRTAKSARLGYFSSRILGSFVKNGGGAALGLLIFFLVERRHIILASAFLLLICGSYGVFMVFGGGRSGPVTFGVLLITAWVAYIPHVTKKVYLATAVAAFLALALGSLAARYRGEGISFEEFPAAFVTSAKPSSIQELYRGVNENKAVALVLDKFGRERDYLWGYSLYTLAANPIPRYFWPGKPIGYGKLVTFWFTGNDPTNPSGYSISTGVMGEGYANFGWLGVPFSGLMIGLFMGITSALLVLARRSPYAGAIGVHLLAFVHPMLRGSWTICINWWLYPLVGFICLLWLSSLLSAVPRGAAVSRGFVDKSYGNLQARQ